MQAKWLHTACTAWVLSGVDSENVTVWAPARSLYRLDPEWSEQRKCYRLDSFKVPLYPAECFGADVVEILYSESLRELTAGRAAPRFRRRSTALTGAVLRCKGEVKSSDSGHGLREADGE